MPSKKVVTCCYCGTRAALVLTGKTRHELSCSSCGAPLHDLKMLPKGALDAPVELVKPSRVRGDATKTLRKGKDKKRKKKKSLGKKLFSEAFDIIEDIFD